MIGTTWSRGAVTVTTGSGCGAGVSGGAGASGGASGSTGAAVDGGGFGAFFGGGSAMPLVPDRGFVGPPTTE